MAKVSAQWTRMVSSELLQRSSQTFSIVDNNAYVFGGELKPREPRDNEMHVLNLQKDASALETVSRDPCPSPRVGSSSAVVDSKIYLFSGRGGTAMTAVEEFGGVWCFTPKTSSWNILRPVDAAAPYPEGRSYHCSTSDGKSKVFIHAGCPVSGRISDFWSFDVTAGTWKQLTSAPGKPRGGTSITYLDGKVYRMGGFDGQHELGGEINVYDVKADSWSTHAFKPDGVSGPGNRSVAALLALKVKGKESLTTLFGESDPSSLGHQGAGKMLGDAWLYDIEGRTWSEVTSDGKLPSPRGWFDADVLRFDDTDAVIVQGGLGESNERFDDVWKLCFV